MQHQSRNDSGADIDQNEQVTDNPFEKVSVNYDVSQVLMGHDRTRIASDKLMLRQLAMQASFNSDIVPQHGSQPLLTPPIENHRFNHNHAEIHIENQVPNASGGSTHFAATQFRNSPAKIDAAQRASNDRTANR